MFSRVKFSRTWIVPIALVWGLLPVKLLAFGATAHRTVGYIAEQELCAEARVNVSEVLEGESLGEAGLWADRIRGDKHYDYAKPWHYINIPDDLTVDKAKRNTKGDVLWAILEMNRRLDEADSDSQEYAEALRFLIHFVADIHQPLHVGRKEDLGGNRIKVTYYKAYGEPPGKSNLHAYWDSDVLELKVDDPDAYAQRLLAKNSAKALSWSPDEPALWVDEGMQLRPVVYGFTRQEGASTAYLDRSYKGYAQLILDSRLYLAGRRLGAVLNARYCAAAEAETPANTGS
jgi:hypothetical protein